MEIQRGQVNARGIVRVQVTCHETEAHAAQSYATEEARKAVLGPVEYLYSVPRDGIGDAWGRDYIFAAKHWRAAVEVGVEAA